MEYYIKRNDFLAVLGDDSHFWLCRSLQNVRQNNQDKFKALWLETQDDGITYRLSDQPNYVPVKSVLKKIRLKLMTDKMSYNLPMRTKQLLEKLVLPSTTLSSSSRTKSRGTKKRKPDNLKEHPNEPKVKKVKMSKKIKVVIDKPKKSKSVKV